MANVNSKKREQKKIYVLDTSILLYNHKSLLSFEENDVVIPITVLEEIDKFKKGNDTINYEAREFIRLLDKLSKDKTISEWQPLIPEKNSFFRVLMQGTPKRDACIIFGEDKPDHRILNSAIWLQEKHPNQKVILVTKDINLRLKAKSLDVTAEDYLRGQVKNIETLYSGKSILQNVPDCTIDKIYKEGFCPIDNLQIDNVYPNHYFIIKNSNKSVLAYYNPETNCVEKVEKRPAYKIVPRNAEQVFSLHAIMNPSVKLVTLQGVAGTGKTLLALAGALEQKRLFKQIYLARPIIPLSNKDIGFLPGDIKSKINPFMEPLYDNLKFIKDQFNEHDKEYKSITEDLEKEKLVITPLAYIRGRSLSNICFIIDEAQNLTPHEVKTIITRAGEGTKMIFTGDIYQIDTPYLDAQSNGLSHLIDRFKSVPIYAHIRLEKGERSELANLANELL